jgi:hypothetical protein
MKNHQLPPKTIDEYIASCSPDVQSILEKIRLTIKEAAPEAEEKISYQNTLISRIVKFRVEEQMARAKSKRGKK